jgi:aryl-alcohol dehydrogenase-like predicted oxidoreductase
VLRQVAAAHDAKPAQIALAWLLGLPQVVVIPGASSVEQMEFNAAAADLDLTDDEQAALTAAARAFSPQSTARTVVEGVRERIEGLRERLGG